jgi:hypothetical protein
MSHPTGTFAGVRRAALILVALLMGVAFVACSGDDDTGGTDGASTEGATDDSGAGFRVKLERSTLFETHRALSLTVMSDRDREMHIEGVQLDSPLFVELPPEEREARVRAGRSTGMPLPFGEPACDGEADGPAQLVATVDGDEVHVPIDESPSDLLATMHGNECAEVEVHEQIDLQLDDGWQRTGPTTIEGDLVMAQRDGGVTAAIDQITGNVLFTVLTDDPAGDANDPAGTWLEVSDDQPSTTGHIQIKVARCDPHALIEFKRPFVLTGFVRLGDADVVRVDIEAQGSARQTMGELMSGCLGSGD